MLYTNKNYPKRGNSTIDIAVNLGGPVGSDGYYAILHDLGYPHDYTNPDNDVNKYSILELQQCDGQNKKYKTKYQNNNFI